MGKGIIYFFEIYKLIQGTPISRGFLVLICLKLLQKHYIFVTFVLK